MSASKPIEMYQGSDWLTYRWPVAQAFDTLDRIRDLCLQMPVAMAAPHAASGMDRPRFEIPDEEIADMFGYIVELCDDLAGELDTVHADLCPVMQGNMAQSWSAFEMRLHLRDLRGAALKETASAAPSHRPPDAILALAARIKTLLKQIDQ
jgi:hypothetical protein